MVQLVLYGSTVADSTLTTANDLATASGGAETSVSNTWGGTGQYGELYSSGGTSLPSSTSIPATPSGHGWIYYVGAGSFALGNWTATFAHSCLDATIPLDFTLRFFKYSGGTYTLIGSIAISPGTGSLTRTVYTFPATALAGVAFDTPDYLYVDLWEHDTTGIAFQDTGTIYLSTSRTAGVTDDLQITTADFAAGAGSGIIDPTIFGTAAADATLTTACDMALTTGGVETSKDTAITAGTGNFAEVWSQGNAAASAVASIAASPTGHGWVYRPGAGTLLAGNWTASITAATSNNNGTWNFRVFSHIGAVYALVGTLTASITGTTKTTYTFAAVSFPAVTLGAADYIYFDLWYQDLSGASSETVTIYEATTTAGGVASDMQINTANFAPVSGLVKRLYVPFGIPRTFGSTLMPTVIKPPLIYTPRAFGATLLTESRIFIPRAFGGVYIPDDPTQLWVPRALGGTTQIPASGALAGTLSGHGILSETFSLAASLTDTLAGGGTLSGTMTASVLLTGTLPGVGTLTGTFSLAASLSVTLPGVGTLTGTVGLSTALSVTLAGVGTLSGTLSAGNNAALTVTMAGVGQLSGTPQLTTALSVTLSGVGTLTGQLSAKTALGSTLAGSGTMAGALALSTSLTRVLSGAGTLAGVFTIRVALSFTFAGMGTFTGSLSLFNTLAQPGIAMVLDALYHQATIRDILVQQATTGDTLRGQASVGDALRGQATSSDVATGNALLSDQG
jgi:hypothetical protein